MGKVYTFCVHDESVNTYGFRMLTSGANLEEFKKNPVVLYNHNDWETPIGRGENVRVEDGRIAEGTFTGDGCAISQASVDIMLDLVIGKTKEEVMHLADLFFRMIKGTVSDEELEELEEASALVDISHMPARVKCAVLGWHTLTEMLGDEPEEK